MIGHALAINPAFDTMLTQGAGSLMDAEINVGLLKMIGASSIMAVPRAFERPRNRAFERTPGYKRNRAFE